MTTPKNRDVGETQKDAVVRLRTRQRLTFRQIATELDSDVKTVYRWWKAAREESNADAKAALDAWRGEQLATLDAVVDGMMPQALAGDSRAAIAIVNAMERTSKLLGLDAPLRANIAVTDEMTARVKALAEELEQAARRADA